jgi:hypothetical protein
VFADTTVYGLPICVTSTWYVPKGALEVAVTEAVGD